ncbi:MAG TPA: hypothetical protein VFP91_16855 [Vicinamibacterales bacterium]|nr:hypothetical protein [Vicinamibacterales bacterium]
MRRLTVAVLVACACGACGLPARTREEAARTAAAIAAENADIARKEASYRLFVASSGYAPYRVYAERERWSGQFEYARAKTAAAKTTYDQYVTPLLQKNDSRDDFAVDQQTSRINRLINEARAYADIPQRRRAYIDQVAGSYARLLQESRGNADSTKAALASLLVERDKARNAFPARDADIDKHIQPVRKLADEAALASQKVSLEAANVSAGRAADLVVLGDNAQLLSRNASTIQEDVRTVDGQLKSLSSSYSRALADMKAVYYITVMRWAWNDDADNPSTHTYTYPRKEITGETFDYFNSLPESLPYIARLKSGFFGGTNVQTNDRVTAARWTALGISPKDQWVSSDDTAEYGFQLSADYFHKYLITENGETHETDWQKVDETMFESHVEDLGMDIVTKPFGSFEDEKITNPTPAGLAFVGNPRYGQWQTDDRGTSFWAWYGAYRLFGDLLGARGQPYYYRRDEWDTWSTRYRGQPYYGEDKDRRERYGTGGYVVGSSNRWASRIPDMRRVVERHSDNIGVRGGVRTSGK